MTVWVYWIWVKVEPSGFRTVSIQNIAVIWVAWAFCVVAAALPSKNPILFVPPPKLGSVGKGAGGVGGGSGGSAVEIDSVVVLMMFCPAMALASTELGLSNMAWVMLGGSVCGKRAVLLLFASWLGNQTRELLDMRMGVMSTGANWGGPAKVLAVPWAKMVVP